MGLFLTQMINHFLISFGVVLGATLLGGIAAVLTLQPPTHTMEDIATNIKIWAVIAAVGGTIDPFRAIETNLVHGDLPLVVKQVLYIISAFIGAHTGTKLMQWMAGGEMF